jgi:hypothetical protein
MTEKLKGGELDPSPSKSRITVGGQTIEEYVAIKEARELGEELVPDNVKPYHKTRLKHQETKGSSSFGRILTRREINEEQWEKIMEAQKTIDEVIITSLLSGKEMSGNQLREAVIKHIPDTTPKSYSTRSSYIYHKTDLGKLIKCRRSAKGMAYKFVPAALDCTVEELAPFLYKGEMEKRQAILDRHIGLKPYLKPNAPSTKGKKIIEPWEEKAGPGPGTIEPEKQKKLEDFEVEAKHAIQNVMPNPLSLNVNIIGKVEIVFRWDKN